MSAKPLLCAGLAGCLAITGRSSADFVCGNLQLVEDDGPGGNWTWRVYVTFDNPADELLAIGGIPDLAPFTFDAETDLVNDGGVFTGLKTEDFPSGSFGGPRDSWVTIGGNLGFPNPTDYSPGFAGSDGVTNIIKGDHFEEDNGGWFNSNPDEPVTGVHLLIAQFTLPSGADFFISGLVAWVDAVSDELVNSFFDVGFGCRIPCVADLDDNDEVGFFDLTSVLANWGPCKRCPEDFDEDGEVGFFELLYVLDQWGPCP